MPHQPAHESPERARTLRRAADLAPDADAAEPAPCAGPLDVVKRCRQRAGRVAERTAAACGPVVECEDAHGSGSGSPFTMPG